MSHKAGFVNIIGNVGKSTLMMPVGERLSIILQKHKQRHRILGIVNGEDFQMILSDTPESSNRHKCRNR
jgi:GTP-binding protein Era